MNSANVIGRGPTLWHHFPRREQSGCCHGSLPVPRSALREWGRGRRQAGRNLALSWDPSRGPGKQGTPALGRNFRRWGPMRPKPAPHHWQRPACQCSGIADQTPGCCALGAAHPMNGEPVHLLVLPRSTWHPLWICNLQLPRAPARQTPICPIHLPPDISPWGPRGPSFVCGDGVRNGARPRDCCLAHIVRVSAAWMCVYPSVPWAGARGCARASGDFSVWGNKVLRQDRGPRRVEQEPQSPEIPTILGDLPSTAAATDPTLPIPKTGGGRGVKIHTALGAAQARGGKSCTQHPGRT